ncbi:MAG: branched-chain amino acid transport system II carrier protein [Sulfuricellaceae bacterium]|jgi:LIVCS family branched-chain amino acid:cation transporter
MIFRILVAGLAVFAMFFGTGNLVFPLMLGAESLGGWPWALAGFALADIALTLAGMMVMLLFDGEVGRFFHYTGRAGQRVFPWLLLLLLGPLVVMPRAISVAHGALSSTGFVLPIGIFSLGFLSVVWLANRRPGHLIEVIGKYFTPVKIALLTIVISACFLVARRLSFSPGGGLEAVMAFGHGFTGGYETMDLIGVVFFGAVIMRYFDDVEDSNRRLQAAFWATTIGMTLLMVCYLALFYLGTRYAGEVRGLPATEMLPRITKIALGDLSEELTAGTIIVANITLTIALSSIFAEYCVSEVSALHGRYLQVLFATLTVDYGMSLLEFDRIIHYSAMLLSFLYPFLIVLTFLNLWRALQERRRAKERVF